MSSYTHLVALGSSFAAGPGIPPVVDRAALRSGRNYAHVLAGLLRADLTDLTVSGATTETIVQRSQRSPLGKKFPPQVEGIPGDADLVTITAGGNDLGYAGSMLAAAWAGWAAAGPLARPLRVVLGVRSAPEVGPAQVERAASGLVDVVAAARARAPHARVVLVDYLAVFGGDTRPGADVPMDQATIDAFRAVAGQLAGAFAVAATRSGTDLVRASVLSGDHARGSADPWVTGFRPSLRPGPTPFHPNAAGMRAVAEAIARALAS